MSRFQSRTGERLHWRVVVRTVGVLDPATLSRSLAWHLAECANPTQDESHCEQGRRLFRDDGDPDGHCLIDGACLRCAMEAAALAPAVEEPAASVAVAEAPSSVVSESPPEVVPVEVHGGA